MKIFFINSFRYFRIDLVHWWSIYGPPTVSYFLLKFSQASMKYENCTDSYAIKRPNCRRCKLSFSKLSVVGCELLKLPPDGF